MRIALATSSYAPHVGGVEEHVRNVARVLRERGHQVVVWTIARDGRFAVWQHEGVEVWDLPAPLPARGAAPITRFLMHAPTAWSQWHRAWRSLRPHVIHVHCFGPNGTYASRLARRTRTPLVVTSHGETMADDRGVFDSSRLARDSLTRAIADADAVTACSHVALDDLRTRFGLATGRGIVVANGIDLSESASGSDPGIVGRYVAAVGRLQRVKGFDLLVKGFAAALPDDGVRLVIGGDGPQRDALLARAQRLGIADRVVLPGRLDRAQVSGLMERAAVIVVPSRFEAFGITALEAWRAGTPLIATDRGGPAEFVTDGVDGLLCDPEDIDALAAALQRILTDADLASGLAEAGLRRVADFSWKHTVDGYEAVYRGLPNALIEAAAGGPSPSIE